MPNENNSELISSIAVAISSLIAGLSFLTKAQTDLAQGKEMTAEERAALDAKIAELGQKDYAQPND